MREMSEGMVKRSISRAVRRVILPNRSWRSVRVQSRATEAAARLAKILPVQASREHSSMAPP